MKPTAIEPGVFLNMLPKPIPIPRFDVDARIAFISRLVNLLMASSHWLVIADAFMLDRFTQIEQALGVTFERVSVPPFGNELLLLTCPANSLNTGLFASHLRGQYQDSIFAGAEPSTAQLICLTSTAKSLERIGDLDQVLQLGIAGERKREGMGLALVAKRLRQAAFVTEMKRTRVLN